jgi:hypothetical protein
MAAGAGARWSAEQDACFRAVALHLAELEKHCEEPAVVRGGSISQVHIKSAAQLFAHELTKCTRGVAAVAVRAPRSLTRTQSCSSSHRTPTSTQRGQVRVRWAAAPRCAARAHDARRAVCESLCEQASRFSSVVRCTLPDAGPTLRATAVAAQRDVFALCLKVAEEVRGADLAAPRARSPFSLTLARARRRDRRCRVAGRWSPMWPRWHTSG